MNHQYSVLSLLVIGLASCQAEPGDETLTDPVTDEASIEVQQIEVAERMIDAFYSFDSNQLRPFLAAAEESQTRLLYYQGWADGGNYKIVNRAPCALDTANTVKCPITVEDDPVLALKIDFKVTDTFTISFDGATIKEVETSSNDKPIYYEASTWVRENFPDVMEGPCEGFFADGQTPADCARAMTEGYRKFAESDDFPG